MENGPVPYSQFIKEVKDLVYRRQYEALKRVNTELIQLYWEIGGEIARKQREDGWGNSIVEILSKELQKEFPGIHGFSARNLWLMRNFYLEYSQNANMQPMVAEMQKLNIPPLLTEISWSKNVAIMQKCKDPLQRDFWELYTWFPKIVTSTITTFT
ncbi:MAG: DUF1016 N-terminal domain-containing protein [Holophagales bacterium]|jgi:hypothetical protein|nr:DUF1016 N-terminal domain-containing protein [Holophagales bacterium]